MTGVCKTCLFIIFMFSGVECARILAYFPTPSISHQVVFRPITQELARRGHKVTLITPDPVFTKSNTPENLTEIGVHDISYEIWEECLKQKRGQREDLYNELKFLFERLTLTFEMQMKVPVVKDIMNKDKNYFDLILLEACHRPVMGLIHKFNAPAIQISSFGGLFDHYDLMGAPIHPLLYPTPESRRLYNLTPIEKVLEVYGRMVFKYLMYVVEEFDYTILKNIFGEDIPPYVELQKRIKMIFLNEHPIWANNRPVPPNIIYMGGIHQNRPQQELSKEIKEYMESSKNGVIYVSFGTNMLPSLLPPEKVKVMVNVFSQLPYDVLWKWDKDVLPGQSNNIHISKWFPQADLLKHPKVKLFITQGGLQSTDEAIDAAVPLIGIPMLGDQWYNVEKYTYYNIGILFDIRQITEINFKKAIITLIEDNSYKNNMMKLRSRMREYPIRPIDLVAEWAEYIIKHGGDHLKSPAAGISWTEYYEIKLVFFLLGIFFMISSIVIYISICFFKLITNIYNNKIKLKKY